MVKKITASALFLALCWVLPLLGLNIPVVGKMLCLMHIPVLLAGILLGWQYGLMIGLIAPITRCLLFGAPAIYPDAIGMTVELAIYGLTSGLFCKLFKNINIYVRVILALLIALPLGRVAWGLMRYFLTIFNGSSFTMSMFIAGAFVNAWPGIILQFVLIPPLARLMWRLFNKNEVKAS